MQMTAYVVHISAGALGIIFGFVALFAAKGGAWHRKSGMIFVYAMLTMSIVGATLAVLRDKAPATNVPVGLLTAYLVITALTAVRPLADDSRRLDFALMLVPSGVCVALLTFAFEALASPTGKLFGMPPQPFFVFAVICLFAIVGDVGAIRAGGSAAIRGAPRLSRHLWRMTVALLIAAFSFFLGQAKVIPKPIRIVPLLVIPPLVVLVALFYWLWRIRMKRSLRNISIAKLRPVSDL
jgi:uncharacterized membrane protein